MERNNVELTASEPWQRFWRLFEPVHADAAATARRLCRSSSDGDDLFQEAVLRAYERLADLRSEDRFRSWFFAILLSIHRNRQKRAFWRRFVPWDTVFGEATEPRGECGLDREEDHWRAERASRALARLPAVQREAVVLYEIDGYSVAEIAAMQGVSESAVKSRLARGRERLRRIYCVAAGDGGSPAAQSKRTTGGENSEPGRRAPTRLAGVGAGHDHRPT